MLGTGQLGFDSLGDIVEDEGSPSPSLEHRSHFKAHRDNAAAAPGPYAGPCQALASLACILHALLCSVQSAHACGHDQTQDGRWSYKYYPVMHHSPDNLPAKDLQGYQHELTCSQASADCPEGIIFLPSQTAHLTTLLPAEGPKARAPSAAVLPSRAVEGVAHAGAPAAGGPALPPHLQPAGSGEILPQKPRSHASVPVQAPGFVSPQLCYIEFLCWRRHWCHFKFDVLSMLSSLPIHARCMARCVFVKVSAHGNNGTQLSAGQSCTLPPSVTFSWDMQVIVGGDNSTALNATQTYTPAPSAFVSDDGTLVLTGPASPGTPLSTSASADRLLWWVVAVILLVGIMCRCVAPLCLLIHVH